MRIISWNCDGSPGSRGRTPFRYAFDRIARFKADIVVLQHVSSPERVEFPDHRVFWHGLKLSGIAVILKRAVFSNAHLVDTTRSSILVDAGAPHDFQILGLWPCPEKPSPENYLLETKSVLEYHRKLLSDKPSIVVGEFNSNVCWDSQIRVLPHSHLLELLAADFGVYSAYHNQHLLRPGQERHSTYFHRRGRDRHFHTNHGFLPAAWRLEGTSVVEAGTWLRKLGRGHCPLVIDCTSRTPDEQFNPPYSEDLEIGIRVEKGISFHLQSRSQGWCHGPDAALDLINLWESLVRSGVHEFLTCACGISNCACSGARGDRARGVNVNLLANGDALWHDRDRDQWYRIPRFRLHRQLLGLAERCRATLEEFSVKESWRMPIRPYRNSVWLDEFVKGLRPIQEEYGPPSESGLVALTYFPELPDNQLYIEIREFTRWLDDERLWPLGTRFVPFAEQLLKTLPEILDLPRLERLVLVLTGAGCYDIENVRWSLGGFPTLRAKLGELDKVWAPLLEARYPDPFDFVALPAVPEVRFRLVAALLRFGEFLNVSSHRPSLSPPRGMFESEEVLLETGDPNDPYLLTETGFNEAGLTEFWKRAYTESLTRTEDGALRLTFRLPTQVAESYTNYLVLPRVAELSELLDIIRQELTADGLTVGPLHYRIETDENVPRMPKIDEELFGMGSVPRPK